MIRTHALTKRYGAVTAVAGIDLDVRDGDVYGFLGPNGSGKTTTVRMLLGLVLPTSGQVEVLGQRIPRHARRVLSRVGTIVEGPAAYSHLSGRANLALLDAAGPGGSRRTRRRRIEAALEQVGLGGVDRRPVKAYSLGMRQRLGLAAAVLRQPELLVLDEPTNGLDPQGIREIRDLLLALNAAGTTIFLSSHLLAEVELMCGRVGVLDRGRLVLQDDLATLRAPTGRVVVRTPDADAAVALLDGQLRERADDRLVIATPDAAELNAMLVGAGIRVRELAAEHRTLEQVVLAATSTGSDRVDRGGQVDRGDRGDRGDGPGWAPPQGQPYSGDPPSMAGPAPTPAEPAPGPPAPGPPAAAPPAPGPPAAGSPAPGPPAAAPPAATTGPHRAGGPAQVEVEAP